jgi:hypothetical protein
MNNYGVYKISFKSKQGKVLPFNWEVSKKYPEKIFTGENAKRDAQEYAIMRREQEKSSNTTSRVISLGLWKVRFFVKKADEKGWAIV